MKRIIILGALACAVWPGFAHRIRVDFQHGVHFSAYKTYRWDTSANAVSPDPLFPNQIMQERIVGFIEEALAAKGLKRVNSGGDLLVSYRMNIAEEPQFTTFGSGPGWGWDWGWGGGISTTTVQVFYSGTLIVDMVDANRQRLVFQGTSRQDISSRPQRNTQRLAKAVNEIFARYPPQL